MNPAFPSPLSFPATLAELHQYAIAFHTASPDLGLALSNFADIHRQQVWSALGQATSGYLHSYLAEFIQPQTWQELGFIAVAQGPGGFTGTRLGVVTARTLAQQLQIPLFAISTLAAVAWTEQSCTTSDTTGLTTQDIAVQMMAHRGELYTAIYRLETHSGSIDSGSIHSGSIKQEQQLDQKGNPDNPLLRLKPVQPDAVMSRSTWEHILETWENPYHLVEAGTDLGETVGSVLELAYLNWLDGMRPHWSEALPFYGQSPV